MAIPNLEDKLREAKAKADANRETESGSSVVQMSERTERPDIGETEDRMSGSTEDREFRTSEVRRLTTSEDPMIGSSELPTLRPRRKMPKLVRKDITIWDDQLRALQILEREVMENRSERGQRLTANTLVRISIDLLVERWDDLVGNTEDELRESIGLGRRHDIPDQPPDPELP